MIRNAKVFTLGLLLSCLFTSACFTDDPKPSNKSYYLRKSNSVVSLVRKISDTEVLTCDNEIEKINGRELEPTDDKCERASEDSPETQESEAIICRCSEKSTGAVLWTRKVSSKEECRRLCPGL